MYIDVLRMGFHGAALAFECPLDCSAPIRDNWPQQPATSGQREVNCEAEVTLTKDTNTHIQT